MKQWTTIIVSAFITGVRLSGQAQVIYSGTTTNDAFVATGSPQNPLGTDLTGDNFGIAGVLAIAPASSVKGEFQTVLQFDLADAVTLFNATYGTNWVVSAISLTFASNVGTEGDQAMNGIFDAVNNGNFVIEWMADNAWTEGTGRPMAPTMDGVTYDSVSTLLMEPHEPLCTNNYVPPGENVPVTWPLPLARDLTTNVMAGGLVSFRLYAADNQASYIFNSHNFGNGNQPLINVTAIPWLQILSGYFTNSAFHLTAIGGTNAVYLIEANNDLATTNWETVGTVTADGAGVMQFDDMTITNRQRFYRILN